MTQTHSLLLNLSTSATTSDDLFSYCWRHQSCEDCLSNKGRLPCSWCDVSRVCVPNPQWPWPYEIFTALKYPEVCPLNWRERWEVRARPWSCRCSAMTLVSVVVAVASTLVAILLFWLVIKVSRWGIRRWRVRQPGWWRARLGKWQLGGTDRSGESSTGKRKWYVFWSKSTFSLEPRNEPPVPEPEQHGERRPLLDPNIPP